MRIGSGEVVQTQKVPLVLVVLVVAVMVGWLKVDLMQIRFSETLA